MFRAYLSLETVLPGQGARVVVFFLRCYNLFKTMMLLMMLYLRVTNLLDTYFDIQRQILVQFSQEQNIFPSIITWAGPNLARVDTGDAQFEIGSESVSIRTCRAGGIVISPARCVQTIPTNRHYSTFSYLQISCARVIIGILHSWPPELGVG